MYNIKFHVLNEDVDPIFGVITCLEHKFLSINECDEAVQIIKEISTIINRYEDVFEGLG